MLLLMAPGTNNQEEKGRKEGGREGRKELMHRATERATHCAAPTFIPGQRPDADADGAGAL